MKGLKNEQNYAEIILSFIIQILDMHKGKSNKLHNTQLL